MRINLCTISFRHELASFNELLDFAARTGFSGIELWSVHAAAIARGMPLQGARDVRNMRRRGIEVAMISGYVRLLPDDDDGFEESDKEWRRLLALARLFETDKVRIFAGNRSSMAASESDWTTCAGRLRQLAQDASRQGIRTVVETHPGTLADGLDAALRLIRDVRHPNLSINLDFLHLWEAGDSIVEAYRLLRPWTVHYHCKNIRDRKALSVFEPDNVYSPGGTRAGMVPLSEGAVDYAEILTLLNEDGGDPSISLEWFGNDSFRYLAKEIAWIRGIRGEARGNLAIR
ncbi:sugar phosphate isomerase/epimerase family protein [Cohnella sp. GCM10027633]|uniref:sugar phosphate isomerase/epimerase family protein n=1 Tax=unclassified Cohnella TaxID=2636738 RepID=UPI003629B8F3